jgi:2-polyprenyl-3-methyl-5-hydroxy-6-metoxy-1,4-benzoquinol methylase
MAYKITDDNGTAFIEELPSGGCEIKVIPQTGIFCPRLTLRTNYSLSLVRKVAQTRTTAWMLDEIARDEDSNSIEQDLHFGLLAYIGPDALSGKSVLDFGCGGGASTMVMTRMFPESNFVGIELDDSLVELARARAEFYGLKNIRLLKSDSEKVLPSELPEFDFVVLSAVYEHLLPGERAPLMAQIWSKLRPGGLLFVNQTPDRRFPIETHTTGLPLINYMPDRVAHRYACRLSTRVAEDADWNSLLRAGIRGTTPQELLAELQGVSGQHRVELLEPTRLGAKQQSDIWYRAAAGRVSQDWGATKRRLISYIHRIGIPIAPYISLAFRKV